MRNLIVSVEAYPDLKSNTNFLELQRQLAETEDRIANGRRYYNANVRVYNTKVESVPTNIIANVFKFEKATYFEVNDPAVRQAPNVSFGEIAYRGDPQQAGPAAGRRARVVPAQQRTRCPTRSSTSSRTYADPPPQQPDAQPQQAPAEPAAPSRSPVHRSRRSSTRPRAATRRRSTRRRRSRSSRPARAATSRRRPDAPPQSSDQPGSPSSGRSSPAARRVRDQLASRPVTEP